MLKGVSARADVPLNKVFNLKKMSARRMFSPKIVSSDAFLDMPVSSQALYFHLGMNADDDGFINPRKIMRMMGAGDDDIKVLITKRFVIPFENGVVVIKHWKINNLIRKDWYKETVYTEQKALLFVKPNESYTDIAPVNKMLTISKHSLVKSSLVKSRRREAVTTPEELKKQFFSDPLMEKVKTTYPDRDYGFQFDLMVNWWLINRKKLPKSISALTNWLKYTKPDELLMAERRRKLDKDELDKKHQQMIETPKANDEKLKQLKEKMNKIGSIL